MKDQNGKVLDLGCGSGRNFSAFKKSQEIYATDFSKKMLEHAKQNAKNLKLNIELKKCLSNNLPFEDNFFDAVLCSAVLHCVDSEKKRQDTIKEIYRVLKPRGQALISTWGRKSSRLKNKPQESFIPWTTKISERGNQIEQRYNYIYDKKELEESVKKAGFKILRSWEERNINLILEK
jgi:ubiquinone/menaquinone biosynthesis C-methylase UbiE